MFLFFIMSNQSSMRKQKSTNNKFHEIVFTRILAMITIDDALLPITGTKFHIHQHIDFFISRYLTVFSTYIRFMRLGTTPSAVTNVPAYLTC